MQRRKFLEKHGIDAYIIHDTTENPSLLYAAGTEFPDPVTYIIKPGETVLAVSPLEHSRAKQEASADRVINTANYREHNEKGDTLVNLLKGLELVEIGVPKEFPVGKARELQEEGLSVKPVEDPYREERREKTSDEIEYLETAQQATEKAMKHVKEVLESSSVKDGTLFHDERPLTSSRMKKEIRELLVAKNCTVPEETIVAAGEQSPQPHRTGSGSLKPGQPIIVDIFPRHRNSYFGDMTRTFCKGEPSEKLLEMHRAVKEALEASLETVEAGRDASQVYGKACDVLEEHGFSTLRSNTETGSGFMHSLGHGVGLELHEEPRLSDESVELAEGNVVTVEPGLYIPGFGGVRIEEMIVVEENGYRNLNSMGRGFRV